MAIKKKGSGAGWIILYGITGFVDLVQAIITFTGFGIFISEAMEVAMPFFLIGYFQFILKISLLTRPTRLLSIIGATGLDALTGGFAPLWIVDVWYIQSDVKKEDIKNAKKAEQEELLQNNIRNPAYSTDENGNPVRRPQREAPTDVNKTNKNGIRPPNGGLK